MASNIIIRTAKKDYVCDKCGHIIKEGSEYLDHIILDSGRCVQHDRYHDDCSTYSDVIRLCRRIEEEQGCLICRDNDGYKYTIVGIEFQDSSVGAIAYTWNNQKALHSISEIRNWYDEKGDKII